MSAEHDEPSREHIVLVAIMKSTGMHPDSADAQRLYQAYYSLQDAPPSPFISAEQRENEQRARHFDKFRKAFRLLVTQIATRADFKDRSDTIDTTPVKDSSQFRYSQPFRHSVYQFADPERSKGFHIGTVHYSGIMTNPQTGQTAIGDIWDHIYSPDGLHQQDEQVSISTHPNWVLSVQSVNQTHIYGQAEPILPPAPPNPPDQQNATATLNSSVPYDVYTQKYDF